QPELEREPHLLEVVEERRDLGGDGYRPTLSPGRELDHIDGRPVLPLLRQRPPPGLAEPAPHRGGRVEVDEEQRFLEPRRPREHLALAVEHDRVAIEDQLVLPPDRVDERDEAGCVPGTLLEHLLTLAVLADVERRRRHVQEQLGAREREVGRRRSWLPHVLADGHAGERLAQPEQEQVAARREVALLVEDAVVGQEPLAIDGLHAAVRTDRAGVVEVALERREADERGDPRRRRGDLVERASGGADEGRAQEEVLRGIARDRELGEEDEVGTCVPRLREPREDQRPVPLQVADDRVDLRERQPHLVCAFQSKTYQASAAEMSASASGFSTDERSPGSRPSTVARTARRTIFADRVFGKAGTKTTRSGANAFPSSP